MHLHTVYMQYSECMPTLLNPLAERTYVSQVLRIQREATAGRLHIGGLDGVRTNDEYLAYQRANSATWVSIGLGRIIALYCRSSSLYRNHEHIRCLYF